jgi:hypothetical protein
MELIYPVEMTHKRRSPPLPIPGGLRKIDPQVHAEREMYFDRAA